MKITFLGAAHEVTGSCTFLEVGDKKGVVDYGMQQGKDLFENEPIPVPPSRLDFILLTAVSRLLQQERLLLLLHVGSIVTGIVI